jgi:hypothetical protein
MKENLPGRALDPAEITSLDNLTTLILKEDSYVCNQGMRSFYKYVAFSGAAGLR